jgi:hypothetical protein
MAFYKPKRRAKPGPSKNEQKIMREKEAERRAVQAGLLRDRYPAVQKLSIRLDFNTPQGHLLDQQARALGPADVCDFSALSCPGRCSGAGMFDLETIVRQFLSTHQEKAENSGVCRVKFTPGSEEICGIRLQCRLEASYSD